MKINLRGRRAYLYRRRWVPAGPDVPHAHPAEDCSAGQGRSGRQLCPRQPL